MDELAMQQLEASVNLATAAADEANTIATYLRFMYQGKREDYEEIISDELNHLIRFAVSLARAENILIPTDGLDDIELAFKEE